MRSWLPLLLVFSSVALPAAAEPLSRAQAVAVALNANPEVRKSLDEMSRLEGLITEARADALPELNLTGSFLRYRDPSLLNSSSFDAFPAELRDSLRPIPANLYEGIASLRQTLFSFKLGKAIRAARLGKSYGEQEIRRVRQAVALSAIRAYNDHLLSAEKVRVAEKAVRQKERHLEMARNRRAAGVATDLDVLRAQVDLENQRTQLLGMRAQSTLSRGRLNAVMLQPIDAPVEPSDTLQYLPVEVGVEEAVRTAWANRPESQAVALAEKIRDELVGIAQADQRPSLELLGAYGYSVREPGNFGKYDFSKWSLGVSLKVPVFDGFRTGGRVAQARAERNKLTQDRLALENQIRLEAQDAVDVLGFAQSIYQAAELNVTQAQKALDMVQANYNHGAATLLDALDAQAALTLAESNRIEALYAHANARAVLRYVMAQDPLDPPAAPGP